MSTISGTIITQTVTLASGPVTTFPTYASPLTINPNSGVEPSSGTAIYGPAGNAWAVANYGTVAATGAGGIGVDLLAGGSVGNSGTIQGYTGIVIAGAAGTVSNSSTITGTGAGTTGVGVELAAGGTITNSGTIESAASNPVYIKGAAGTIVNSGLIENLTTAHAGVYLQAGGLITNAAGGTIASGRGTIRVADTVGTTASFGTVINAGTIRSTGITSGFGVYFQQGGIVTNQTSGLITAYLTAVLIRDTAGTTASVGTVVNFGTIQSTGITSGGGVYFGGGGTLTNEAGAAIVAIRNSVNIANTPATVTNYGTIESTGTNATIYSRGGGVITNHAGAIIEAAGTGSVITFRDTVGTTISFGSVINSGTIESLGTTGGTGIYFGQGGVITNAAGATIASGHTGISFNDTLGTTFSFGSVINAGTIESVGTTSGVGIYFGQGGILTNQSTGLITAYRGDFSAANSPATVANYGTIQSTGTANAFTGVFLGAGGTVINHGVITQGGTAASAVNISGGAGRIANYGIISVIHGGAAGVVNADGIFLGAGGTITNQGTVSASVDNGGGAVSFGAAGGTLVNGTAGSTQGLITAYHVGVGFFVGTAGSTGAATITNYGTIQTTQPGTAAATGFGSAAVQIGTSATGVVVNFGTISAAGTTNGQAISLQAGGRITNSASGLITAATQAIGISGSAGTVVNSGTISGVKVSGTAFVTGINLNGGGTVINGTAGSTAGLITAYDDGISSFGTAVSISVVNYGTIQSTQTGTAAGTNFVGFGVQTGNSATAAITNFGTISSAQTNGGGGILLGDGGSVTNSASGLITSPFQAISIGGSAGKVVNKGTISETGTGFNAIFLGAGGTVIDSGTISAASGVSVNLGGTGSNLLVLEHGYKLVGGVFGSPSATNTVELAGSLGATVTVGYNGLGLTNFRDVLFGSGGYETLKVTNTSGTLAPTISGFTLTSDVIDLTAIGTNGTISQSGTLVTVTGSLGSVTLQGDATDAPHFKTTSDLGTGTDVMVACFCRGTRILTERGEVAIEDLAIGDRAITVSGEARPIKWIGQRAYDPRFVAGNAMVLPIQVKAGALADGIPARDLFLSPEHALWLDGLLAPAGLLANGATIRQVESIARLEYFHIELAAHDLIFSEGAAAESYVECDNRGMFHNAAEFAALYPGDAPVPWQFCAPRLEATSAELGAIRAALWSRAEALGHTLTDDPDLHLIVDGEIVRADSVVGCGYHFTIPAGRKAAWLASRSVVPAEMDAASQDGRRLGVGVERIVLCDGDVRTEIGHGYAGLSDGFHENESGHRWTDGLAHLPEEFLRPFAGAVTLEVQLITTGLHYRLDPPAGAARVNAGRRSADQAPGPKSRRPRRARAAR